MTISPAQIRAARALLNLSGTELANRLGMSPTTISMIESGKNPGSMGALKSIESALTTAGVVFTEDNGVKLRANSIVQLSGHEGMKAFMDAVYDVCSKEDGQEVLIANSNDALFIHWMRDYDATHRKRMSKLKSIKFRAIANKDDKNAVSTDYCQYRWMFDDRFKDTCVYVFGGNTALVNLTKEACQITLLSDPMVSETMRQLLDVVWMQSKEKPRGK